LESLGHAALHNDRVSASALACYTVSNTSPRVARYQSVRLEEKKRSQCIVSIIDGLIVEVENGKALNCVVWDIPPHQNSCVMNLGRFKDTAVKWDKL